MMEMFNLDEAKTNGLKSVFSNSMLREEHIVFYDDEYKPPEESVMAIEGYGYKVVIVKGDSEFQTLANRRETVAVIIRHRAGIKHILKLAASINDSVGGSKIILISNNSDIKSRLQSLRAGINSYLLAPCSEVDILGQISNLHTNALASVDMAEQKPIRVLLVEEDSVSLAYHEAALMGRGMVVRKLGNWLAILEEIVNFSPDIVLMDQTLSQTSGGELARIVRMDQSHDYVPIIFLANSDLNADRNFLMDSGGDDVLIKPVNPRQLFLSVEARVMRFRRIRSGMTRDGLTDLLDHKNLMLQLEVDLGRVKRVKGELAYAMIDIDHFKQVNDTHGHARGDQVIKAMAHHLTTKLRKTDTIGRYGGEEFGIILPDASLSDASRIIDNIRKEFKTLSFGTGDNQFSVTFSVGLSAARDYNHYRELVEAADRALYQAKQQGRDRLVISTRQQ